MKKTNKFKCENCDYKYNKELLGCCPLCHFPNNEITQPTLKMKCHNCGSEDLHIYSTFNGETEYICNHCNFNATINKNGTIIEL